MKILRDIFNMLTSMYLNSCINADYQEQSKFYLKIIQQDLLSDKWVEIVKI